MSMAPNAWGDFFAGCFAPLAFLWLVLGYLQQGEELRLSTEALRLQAEELRNSVEQQRALVEVSRHQVESEREALLQERALRDEEAKPLWSFETSGGAFRGDGHCTYNIGLSNTGNIASAVLVTLTRSSEQIDRLLWSPVFNKGDHQIVRVEVQHYSQVEGCVLEIQFSDKFSRRASLKFRLIRESDDPHSGLLLEPLK